MSANVRGDFFKNRMYIVGLNQKEIAKAANMSEAMVSNIVNGKYRPSVEKTKVLAKLLDMDEREFRASLLGEVF